MQKQRPAPKSHKLKDLVKSLGLAYPYLTKVISKLPEYFEGETFRGDKNAIYLTDQGLYILKQISKLRKKRAYPLPELKKELAKLDIPKTTTIEEIPEAGAGFDIVIQDVLKILISPLR